MSELLNTEVENKSRIPIPVPLYYSNGVSVGLSTTDVQLMATVYGRPACQLILPPSAAKSLLKALEEALKDYEARTGNELLNLEELAIQMSTKK